MRRLIRYAIAGLSATIAVISFSVSAQSINLSPAQQQMLNTLPPDQREQALEAIRQFENQQSISSATSINEELTSPLAGQNGEYDRLLVAEEARAEPHSRLVIRLTPMSTPSSSDLVEIDEDPVLNGLVGSRFYTLDESGVLSLPGLVSIPLLGMSEDDIDRRLGAVAYLSALRVETRILGREPIGVEALKPYGYDVFEPQEAELATPSGGPVPADYVLGPGDALRVQLFGSTNGIYEQEISRDGMLSIPDVGPVVAAGIPFSEFRADFKKRVEEGLFGTSVTVSMGQLRTIRVFVLGDVNRPGSYVIGGLSTISSALYQSGGVGSIGSLRNIQLKRNGRLISTFDAYDLLVRGDSSGDRRVQPGDVIFVPPIGKTVAIAGAVSRPAIYEVKRLTTAADLVRLAGGLSADASAADARIERIGADGQRSMFSVDLGAASANDVVLGKGDLLIVPEILPETRNSVSLVGHVYRPGSYAWRSGMRLSDLIQTTAQLQPGVDTDYILIRRENNRGEPIQVLSASLSAALAAPDSNDDLALRPNDIVNVFSLTLGRQLIVEPLLDELQAQATIDQPARRVEISGKVRAAGEYPLESGMRISDLLRAGGSLTEDAYAIEAELTRYSLGYNGNRESTTQQVDLSAILRGESAADLVLQEHDYLLINPVPEWDAIWSVTLKGEVVFPGRYRVRRGETLADVVRRAGGLTSAAFAEGAVFLRKALREREQDQIESLARRMEADLTSLSLQSGSGGGDTLSTGRALLDQLQSAEAVGRLVIDLESELRGVAGVVEVRDGDQLMVPTYSQVVTVLGETQQNTSHLFKPSLTRNEYIELSGGLTRRADRKLIYVVRADGSVVSGNSSRWFGRKQGQAIRPGDTIVVPLDTGRMRPLTFWGNVTQILYQGAIAVAAVRTFNN